MNLFDVITGICAYYMCFVAWNIATDITKHSTWIHKKLEMCPLLSIFIFYQTSYFLCDIIRRTYQGIHLREKHLTLHDCATRTISCSFGFLTVYEILCFRQMFGAIGLHRDLFFLNSYFSTK